MDTKNNRLLNSEDIAGLKKRFLSYVQIWTTSDSLRADEGIQPSTEGQRSFAGILEQELRAMGIQDVEITDKSYLIARIPPSKGRESAPSVGFCSHLDTVEEVSGKDVRPQVIEQYTGKAVDLGNGVMLDPAFEPDLLQAVGHTIITTDGTTLLGADDKAGLAEIMTAAAFLMAHPEIEHGPIEILFSPDEETGHGMDGVPLEKLQSKQFYTMDGGNPPEIEIECFNAWRCDVQFSGKSKHTGTARPDMVNAISMASDFISLLPRHEAPETTDGYQGFYAPMEISGQIESASVILFLRDFSRDGMDRRLETVAKLAAAVEAKYAGSAVSVRSVKQYLNMKEGLGERPEVAELLVDAVRAAGAEPVFTPIRGGTDGSRLTEMGIPCPNIFTGGHNFHSRSEWASLDQMSFAVEVLLRLAVLWGERHDRV